MTGLQDANRQTALDLSALLSILLGSAGVPGADLDANGSADFDAADVAYIGHSNGGRYGMLLAAHEERLGRAALLAPPGDGYIPYISMFRPGWAALFAAWTPPLTNGPSSRYGLFEEGITWPGDSWLDAPQAFHGINRYTVRRTWLAGDADGEGAAHLWRLARAAGQPRPELLIQLVSGDPAVANPDSMRMIDAAGAEAILALVQPDATGWRATLGLSDLYFRHLVPLMHGRVGYPPADLGRLARAQVIAFLAGADDLDLDADAEALQLQPDRRALRFLLGFDFWELRRLYRF
jgi:hypothetical protein